MLPLLVHADGRFYWGYWGRGWGGGWGGVRARGGRVAGAWRARGGRVAGADVLDRRAEIYLQFIEVYKDKSLQRQGALRLMLAAAPAEYLSDLVHEIANSTPQTLVVVDRQRFAAFGQLLEECLV